MYDVIIIGAGIAGCAIARELSRYKLSICVVEKEEDVCCGTSKANSAIIHAGYDALPGTLKAELNVIGNSMMDELSRELDFEFRRNGSLVVMRKDDDRSRLEELYERGIKNKVPGIRIIEKDELMKLEPNLSSSAVAALYAPTAGIVCPFGMTIAYAENAFTNGVKFMLDTTVENIGKTNGGYRIKAVTRPAFKQKTEVELLTRTVVNAAGVYSDILHNMVSKNKYHITPRRGCYFLLDKTQGHFVERTLFSLPGKAGKGILTTPTVHGNLLIGPTANDVEDRDAVNTTEQEFETVRAAVNQNLNNPPLKSVITSFAGLRAHEDGGDFIIGECADAEGFFDCVGIESPGLSAGPAIGVMVAGLVARKLAAEPNPEFNGSRKGILNPAKLSPEEQNKLIAEKPEYGNIVCRCEMVTEGEITDAITRPLGARSLDGVKRRTRAGMGRCQTGFCSPKTMEILSRELNIPLSQVTKSGAGSYIIPNCDINEKYKQKQV